MICRASVTTGLITSPCLEHNPSVDQDDADLSEVGLSIDLLLHCWADAGHPRMNGAEKGWLKLWASKDGVSS